MLGRTETFLLEIYNENIKKLQEKEQKLIMDLELLGNKKNNLVNKSIEIENEKIITGSNIACLMRERDKILNNVLNNVIN